MHRHAAHVALGQRPRPPPLLLPPRTHDVHPAPPFPSAAAAAGPNDERGTAGDDLLELNRLQLTGLAQLVGGRGGSDRLR